MKFIGRLMVFMLGFILGVVGVLGGLVGSLYYAYTGLTLTKLSDYNLVSNDLLEDYIDPSSETNIKDMSLQDILANLMYLWNGTSGLTLRQLEEVYGLDLSELNLPDEMMDWDISLLIGDTAQRKHFLDAVSFKCLFELLSKTLEITYVDENLATLRDAMSYYFDEKGNVKGLKYVGLLFNDDGSFDINNLYKVFEGAEIQDLIPSSMMEGLDDYLLTTIDAVLGIDIGDLLKALINGEGDVIALELEAIADTKIADCLPESLQPVKDIFDDMVFGDIMYMEDNEDGTQSFKFDKDVFFDEITLYEILDLSRFFDTNAEELIAKITTPALQEQARVLLAYSLYELFTDENLLENALGELTFGDLIDFILSLVAPDFDIYGLPEPLPEIYGKLDPIKLIDIVKGIMDGDYSFILDDALYTLTLDDLVGYYIRKLAEDMPAALGFVLPIYRALMNISVQDVIDNGLDAILNPLMDITLGDLLVGFVYEGKYSVAFLDDPEGVYEAYEYEYDDNGERIEKLPQPVSQIFEKIQATTIRDILCMAGVLDDYELSIMDWLKSTVFTLTIDELVSDYFALVPEEFKGLPLRELVQPIYDKIKVISINDIIDSKGVAFLDALKSYTIGEVYDWLVLIAESILTVTGVMSEDEYLYIPYTIRKHIEKTYDIKITDLIKFLTEDCCDFEKAKVLFKDLFDTTLGELYLQQFEDILNAIERMNDGWLKDFLKDCILIGRALLETVKDVTLCRVLELLYDDDSMALVDAVYEYIKYMTFDEIFGSYFEATGFYDWIAEQHEVVRFLVNMFVYATLDEIENILSALLDGNVLPLVEFIENKYYELYDEELTLGFFLAWPIEKIEEAYAEGKLHRAIALPLLVILKAYCPVKYSEVVDAVQANQYSELLKPLAKLTIADIFAEGLDYVWDKDKGEWYCTTGDEVLSLFVKLDNMNRNYPGMETVYDMFFYMASVETLKEEILHGDLIEVVIYFVEIICPECEYDNHEQCIKDMVDRFGSYALNESIDWEYVLGDFSIGNVIDIIEARISFAIPSAVKELPIYQRFAGITIAKLIWHYDDAVAVMHGVTVGEIVDVFELLFGEINPEVELYAKLLANVENLSIYYDIYIMIKEGRTLDLVNMLLNKVSFQDLIDALLYYTIENEKRGKVNATDLLMRLDAMMVGNLLTEEGRKVLRQQGGDTTIGEIFDLVLVVIDEVLDTTDWTKFEVTIYNNVKGISFNDICDVIDNGNTETLVRSVLADLTIGDFVETIEARIYDIDDTVTSFTLYKKVAAIKLIDLIYDIDIVIEVLKAITVGDVMEIFEYYVFELKTEVELFAKLKANTYGLAIYNDIIAKIQNGEHMELIKAVLKDVTFADIINAILYYAVDEAKFNELNAEALMVRLDGMMVANLLTEEGRKLLKEQGGDTTIGEIIDFVLTAIEKSVDTSTWTKFEATIYNGVKSVSFNDIIDAIDSMDAIKVLLRKIFDHLTIGDLIDTIDYRVIDIDGAVFTFTLYTKLAGFEIYDIILNGDDFIDTLRGITIGDLMEIVEYYWFTLDTDIELFAKLKANAYALAVYNDIIVMLRNGQYMELLEAVLKDITLCDVLDFGLRLIPPMIDEIREDILATELFKLFDTILITDFFTEAGREGIITKLEGVQIKDIIEVVSAFLGVGFDKTDWTKLEVTLYNNLGEIYIVDIIKAFGDLAKVEELIQSILGDLTIGDFLDTVDYRLVKFDDAVFGFSLYQKLAAIKLVDLIFNIDSVIEILKAITVGDIMEIVEHYLFALDTKVELFAKLKANTYALEIYNDIIFKIINGEVNLLLDQILAGITFADLVNVILYYTVDDAKYAELNAEALMLRLDIMEVVDLLSVVGRDNLLEQGGDILIKEIIDFVLKAIDASLDTADWANFEVTIYNNVGSLSIANIVEAFGDSIALENLVRKILGDLDLDDVVELIDVRVVVVPSVIKTFTLYTKLADIKLVDLFFDFDSVAAILKAITVGDVMEIVEYFLGEIPVDIELFAKLKANTYGLAIYNDIIVMLQNGQTTELLEAILANITFADVIDGILSAFVNDLKRLELSAEALMVRLDGMMVANLLTETGRDLLKQQGGDTTIGEIIDFIVTAVDGNVDTTDWTKLETTIYNNVKAISFNDIFDTIDSGDFETLIKNILGDLDIGDVIDTIDKRVYEFEDVVFAFALYNKLADIKLVDLFFDFDSVAAILKAITVGDVMEIVEHYLGEINPAVELFAKLKANTYALAIYNDIIAKIQNGEAVALLEAILANITFADLVNVILYYTVDDAKYIALNAEDLMARLDDMYLADFFSEAGKDMLRIKGGYIAINDIIDFIVTALDGTLDITTWTKLEATIYTNIGDTTIGDILDAVDYGTFDALVKGVLADLDIGDVFDTFDFRIATIYSEIKTFTLYNKLADIKLVDLFFDFDSVAAILKAITVGDIMEIVEYYLGEIPTDAKLIAKLKANTYGLAIYNDIITKLVNGEATELLKQVLANITVCDVLEFLLRLIPIMIPEVRADILATDLFKLFDTILLTDFFTEEGREGIKTKLEGVQVNDITEVIFAVLSTSLDTSDWSYFEVELYTNISDLYIVDIIDAFGDSAKAEALVNTMFDTLDIGDLLDCAAYRFGFAIDDQLKATALYTKLADVMFVDLFFDFDSVATMLKAITVGDVMEIFELYVAQLPVSIELFAKLKSNTYALAIYNDIIVMLQNGQTTELLEAILANITFADVIDGILSAFVNDLKRLELSAEALMVRLDGMMVANLLTETGRDLLKQQGGDTTIGEIIDFIVTAVDGNVDTTDWTKLETTIYNNVKAISFNDIFDTIDSGDFETLIKNILGDLDIGDVIDTIDKRVYEFEDVVFAFALYNKLADIKLVDLFFDFDSVAAILKAITVGDVMEIVEYFLGEIPVDIELFAKLKANTYGLAIYNDIIVMLQNGQTTELLEAILANITFADVIDGILSAFVNDLKRLELSAEALMVRLDGMMVANLLTETGRDLLKQQGGDTTIGEIIDFIVTAVDGNVDTTDWTKLETTIYNNVKAISFNDIFDTIDSGDFETLIKNILGDLDIGDVIDTIDKRVYEFEDVVFAFALYNKLADIKLVDLFFDFDSVAAILKAITVGDVMEIVEYFLGEIPVDIELFAKLKANTYALAIYNDIIVMLQNGDVVPLLQLVLANITFADVIDGIMSFVMGVADRAQLRLTGLMIILDTMLTADLLTAAGRDHLYEQSKSVKFGYFVEAYCVVTGISVITTDWCKLERTIYNGLYDLSIGDFIDTLADAAKREEVLRKVLDDLDLGDIVDLIDVRIVELPDVVFAFALYNRLADITIINLIYDIDYVIYEFKMITVGDIMEIVEYVAGEIPTDIKLFAKLKANTYSLAIYNGIIKTIKKGETIELLKDVLNGITFGDVIDAVLRVAGIEQTRIDDIESLKLFTTFDSMLLANLLTAEGRATLLEQVKYIEVGDLTDFVLYILDKTVDTTSWSNLEATVYGNLNDMFIINVVEAFYGGSKTEYAVRWLIEDLDIEDVVATAGLRFGFEVPVDVKTLSLYNKIVVIRLVDIAYDMDAVAEQLKTITMIDLLDAVLLVIPSMVTSIRDNVKASAVGLVLDGITIGDLTTESGRETSFNEIKALTVGDLIDLALIIMARTIDTSDYAYIEITLYNNLKKVTLGELFGIFDGTTDAEALAKGILGDLNIEHIISCLEYRLGFIIDAKVKALTLYGKLTTIKLSDIFFDFDSVLTILKAITVGDVM
ncbi:MAG: hypothetical protein PHX51_06310, partial [Clostridia bacterium]|nr:hypothetical protein [Clostridia bacterium]